MLNPSSSILIKIGGSTLGTNDTSFLDIASLHKNGNPLIVVHGGGPILTDWMNKLGIEAKFANGLRITDASSLEVAVSVLSGLVNKKIVAELRALGINAIGITGVDGGLIQGKVTDASLGFVAGSIEVNESILVSLLSAGLVPVIAPIAVDIERPNQLLNVNADTIAGEIAATYGTKNLIFLSDVDGVFDGNGKILEEIKIDSIDSLINLKVISGGMIPKIQACHKARVAGVRTSIINGTKANALLDHLNQTLICTEIVI
jgi:acetylglutamate kinase